MMTVVPVGRIAPMAGNMPLRTFHSAADSAASVVKRSGVASASVDSGSADGVDLQRQRGRRSRRGSPPAARRRRPAAARSVCRHARLVLHRAQRGAVQQFDRGHRRVLEQADRAAGGFEMVEQDQRAGLVRMLFDREVADLADEAERAFRADHQVRQDVHRIIEIDERVQAVAGGVLHAELVADAAGECRVLARRARQFGQPRGQLGPLLQRRRRGWRHRACRAPCRRPAPRAVPASV